MPTPVLRLVKSNRLDGCEVSKDEWPEPYGKSKSTGPRVVLLVVVALLMLGVLIYTLVKK
jgi:hypothetical protein